MADETTPASQPPARARIVVVEDDTAFQDLLDTVLTAEGYTVLRWTQGAGADAFIRTMQPDLVILDLWLEHPQAGSMVLGLLMVDPMRIKLSVVHRSAPVIIDRY
jgi:CheY-like chemotaxis protein